MKRQALAPEASLGQQASGFHQQGPSITASHKQGLPQRQPHLPVGDVDVYRVLVKQQAANVCAAGKGHVTEAGQQVRWLCSWIVDAPASSYAPLR